jgi:anhydro-N-acetylmuramic acid kinase
MTVQMINLNCLAGELRVDVCGNFRELDVFRGGQGAPLAPFGEEIFAGESFINFGGIANISYRKKGYDINFCNLLFNYVSEKYYNCAYDKDGQFGREGTPN